MTKPSLESVLLTATASDLLVLEARFKAGFSIPVDADSCWLWNGPLSPRGYGKFFFKKRHFRASRIAYFLANGAMPDDMMVCHHCDTPRCVRASHLFLGTHQDNHSDRDRKGRNTHGENHLSAKLTVADVRAIRADPRSGPKIGAAYNVASTQIYNIKKRRTWKHVA